MVRTVGSKNVVTWEKRSEVPTTASADIKHLASTASTTPLAEFVSTLSHQKNYLTWIDTRHEELSKLKKTKDSTFRKYRWYAEQQSLFEALNAFEVFYKRTFINLGKALRAYIPSERISGNIDARILWSVRGKSSVASLIFEHQLFHDLEQIDKASQMLVDKRRYNIKNPSKPMRPTVMALHAAFQVRHTLAHNQGYVTTSDSAKFQISGYKIEKFEVIDPEKEQTSEAIRRFLKQEAQDYTTWLLEAATAYLKKQQKDTGIELRKATLKRIENSIGKNANLSKLPWV